MKQNVIIGIVVFVIVGLLFVIVWGSNNRQSVTSESQGEQTLANITPAITTSNTPIFFYGNTCPHCKDVEEWMDDNNIEEKITIIKKEVYDNPAHSLELTEVAKSCGLRTNSIGVPFLYTLEKERLIGTPDIIDYLTNQVNKLPQEVKESQE